MASESTIEVLQGELERLFDLEGMMRLSADALGFDPQEVGGTSSKGAFARSLVGYCEDQEALDALVDAILLSADGADASLRSVVRSFPNGELKPGTRVGHLKVVKKIGEGGLSIVYLAEGEGEGDADGARAALKVIRPQYARDRGAVHRFTTMSRIMQKLHAPGLAPILEVGQLDDARPWVAAEYLNGQSLAERVKRTGSLHINEARPIFQGVLHGLLALHGRGLLHGDIKTENIFIVRAASDDGPSEPTGVLVDAGADRLLTRIELAATTTGLLPVLGTAKAIAPEQARGLEADQRSDIYQFGTMMYETLAGRPPFEGETAIDVIAQHLSGAPKPPSAHARKGWVSEALDQLVLRALAKDPGQRFQDAQELLDALERLSTRPTAQRPLDESAFAAARRTLLERPFDDECVEHLEALGNESGAWSRVAEALNEGAARAVDAEVQIGLLFRVARIFDSELKEPSRAEAVYGRILALAPDNEVALRGIEQARRAAGDHEGLLEVLLDRVERETTNQARTALLHEVATLYEKKLSDAGNALVAYTQALIVDPHDKLARREITRLCGPSDARWGEVLTMLSESAQDTQAALLSEEEGQEDALPAARETLTQAQAALDELRGALARSLEARGEEASQRRAANQAEFDDAAAAVSKAQAELEALEQALAEAAKQVEASNEEAEAKEFEAQEIHAQAEQTVEAYEKLEAELGDSDDETQVEELARLGDEAEQRVEAAANAEEAATLARQTADEVRAELVQAQERLDAAQGVAAQAQAHVDSLSDVAGDSTLGTPQQTEEERAQLAAAEQQVASARRAVEALENRDASEAELERQRDLADLAELYVLMGKWYGERLNRPDFALSCFSQALTIDETNEGGYDGVIDLYRTSQSWAELAQTLLQRADRTRSPVKARDHRAEAALIIARKLGDPIQARVQFERVLADDPSHEVAQDVLAEILREQEDFDALAELLERRLRAQEERRSTERDVAKLVQTRLELGGLYEDHVGDLEKAEQEYREALSLSPRELQALKGLEAIYVRKESFEPLLDTLRQQVDLAPTPKQRIGLLERIGLLQEEEFVDHAAAAQSFEDIVAIDAAHEGANTALARLYRHLSRYEDVVEALERHAAACASEQQKVELLLHAARVLTVDIGSPERAIEAYEQVLAIDEQQAEALEEVAKLKSTAGDVEAALRAVERLAEQEGDARRQCEQWVRAGDLLRDTGDRDGAIKRYKRALDADPYSSEAASALREIYDQRGDARGAADMLLHAIEITEGDLRRAALLSELGVLYRDKLEDGPRAHEAFETAIELDATNTIASGGLARLAFDEGRTEDALELYDTIAGRIDELPGEEAAALCIEAAEAREQFDQLDQAIAAYKRASELMPDEISFHERYAEAVARGGDVEAVERLYKGMLERFDDRLSTDEKLRLSLSLADAQLDAGNAKHAIATIKEVLDSRPKDPDALDALTRAHEAAGDWNEVINLLQLRSRRAIDDDENFGLLVKTGDVFLEHIHDADAASQTYVMALELEPDNRNLLTKLMAVYSDAQDWPRLIEIILRIAEMVDDDAQLAKYYNTAATIAHLELGRYDEAADYYEQALSHQPASSGESQFNGLVQCLTENQDWDRLERAYELRIERLKEQGDVEPSRLAQLLDARGEIIQHRLGRLADALRVFEEALSLEPDNQSRREMLTAIYTKEPKRFFQQAVASHRALLAADPYRVDSLQALRKIYTSAKKPDESWCLCQALRCLKMADVDEEKFFKKYRLTRLAKTKAPITDELWRHFVVHPEQDPALTAIFATLEPAVTATQAQALSAFGISDAYLADPYSDSTAMGRMLAHVGDTLSLHLPPIYHAPHDAGGLSFLFTAPPSIGIGQGAKAGGPQQALAFVAGRHLSYFRPGHFLRQFVPTGTGLRAWLMAAIRMVAPRFPVPANMEAQVKECLDAIKQQLPGPQRDALRSITQKLLEAAPELDMKRWMAGVDLTADRIGFVLSNDLKIANAVIEASPEEASSVPRRDRLRELLVYSTSEPYLELRKRLGIALGG